MEDGFLYVLFPPTQIEAGGHHGETDSKFVTEVFDYPENLIGLSIFRKVFSNIFSDNGS